MVTAFKILHTAFLFCTGLRSSNIAHDSVLNRIFDTAKIAYCFLNDQYTDNSSFVLRADQTKKRQKAQIMK